MLFREVEVSFRDMPGKYQPVVFFASGLSQLLKPFKSQHFPRVSGASRRVDHDVDYVNSFRRKLRVESLAELRRPPIGLMRMLTTFPRIAAVDEVRELILCRALPSRARYRCKSKETESPGATVSKP